MYMIFDATGINNPKNYKAEATDVHAWPELMHLSWIMLDKDLKPVKDYNCYIKPKNWKLSEKIASRAHISEDEYNEKADDISEVLDHFSKSLEDAEFVFSHNLNVNENIVACAYKREGLKHKLFSANRNCLMLEGTYYAKVPSRYKGYKWPSLTELHGALFKKGYSPVNNARADVIAASRCFIGLHKIGAFDDIYEQYQTESEDAGQ